MEPQKLDPNKLSDMVMCGDHPSFTKTELNIKEGFNEKEKPKEREDRKLPVFYGRITPSQSRAGVISAPCPAVACLERGERKRAASEHGLQATTRNAPPTTRAHTHLLQAAALGSFRWPPYLLCVWVLVLILGHVLHCLVGVLERTLPTIKKFCLYFRTWTEESWKAQGEVSQRAVPVALAGVTGALYVLYCAVYVAYSVALWAVEPLCDVDDKTSSDDLPKVTNYIEDISSRLNTSVKQ